MLLHCLKQRDNRMWMSEKHHWSWSASGPTLGLLLHVTGWVSSYLCSLSPRDQFLSGGASDVRGSDFFRHIQVWVFLIWSEISPSSVEGKLNQSRIRNQQIHDISFGKLGLLQTIFLVIDVCLLFPQFIIWSLETWPLQFLRAHAYGLFTRI